MRCGRREGKNQGVGLGNSRPNIHNDFISHYFEAVLLFVSVAPKKMQLEYQDGRIRESYAPHVSFNGLVPYFKYKSSVTLLVGLSAVSGGTNL